MIIVQNLIIYHAHLKCYKHWIYINTVVLQILDDYEYNFTNIIFLQHYDTCTYYVRFYNPFMFDTFNSTAVNRVLKKSHSLSGCNLTVKEKKGGALDMTDSAAQPHLNKAIEVSGFKSDVSEEMLMMYFENTRRSGGGDILEIQMNARTNNTIITFEDPTGKRMVGFVSAVLNRLLR